MPASVPSETAREGRDFEEVTREALRVAEEVIRGAIHSDPPIPPPAIVEDPLFSIEDLLEEDRADPAASLLDASPKQASPAQTLTLIPPGSTHFAPIILDDGK